MGLPDPLGLLGLALAAFFVWETLLPLVPFRLPGLVQAALVYALAFGLDRVPVEWLIPAAVAGALGILHRWVGQPHIPATWRMPQLRPDKSQQRAKRIPGLP